MITINLIHYFTGLTITPKYNPKLRSISENLIKGNTISVLLGTKRKPSVLFIEDIRIKVITDYSVIINILVIPL